jgi:hypothetical protein
MLTYQTACMFQNHAGKVTPHFFLMTLPVIVVSVTGTP